MNYQNININKIKILINILFCVSYNILYKINCGEHIKIKTTKIGSGVRWRE